MNSAAHGSLTVEDADFLPETFSFSIKAKSKALVSYFHMSVNS